MILLWIIIPIFILYSLLIIYYWQSWISIPPFITPQQPLQTRISVIVAARNEEENIGRLLNALQKQAYPKELYEVIVIDDHSKDRTSEIIRQYHYVKLLRLQEDGINSYKKKAIEMGIAAATGEWIVTTDADCEPGEKWLQAIAAFGDEHESVFIAAPVVIHCNSSLVQIFQALDFMILQGITGAVVYKNKLSMCNGANLVYEKKAFYDAGGFENIDHIASGDDMLLMHKVWKKFPGRVHYLKSEDAIVATQAAGTWHEFFSQRIRWASKARRYEDKRILPVLLLVYLFNLSFLVLLAAGFINARYWICLLLLWGLKTLIEFPFFISVSKFFKKQWAIKLFFFFQPLHIAYTIVSGLFGQIIKYEWKGRRVK
jgi:cellulose synthase/poly-beta-1,6-N-acetylglucosamine synthase-like glycosyltransferase